MLSIGGHEWDPENKTLDGVKYEGYDGTFSDDEMRQMIVRRGEDPETSEQYRRGFVTFANEAYIPWCGEQRVLDPLTHDGPSIRWHLAW